jgi:ADP-heptose:LPS heptosyltransferase
MVPDRTFLLTGSPADEDRCDLLRRSLIAEGIPAILLVGRDGLGEIARVLMHAELLVSVNTGIMHLGAILGVPTVSINGPTSSLRWGPVGPRVANACPSDGSGGFLDLGFEFHGHSTDTMKRILVEDVMSAIRSVCGSRNESGLASKFPEDTVEWSCVIEEPVVSEHAAFLKSS